MGFSGADRLKRSNKWFKKRLEKQKLELNQEEEEILKRIEEILRTEVVVR